MLVSVFHSFYQLLSVGKSKKASAAPSSDPEKANPASEDDDDWDAHDNSDAEAEAPSSQLQEVRPEHPVLNLKTDDVKSVF